jgi:hypothetical protein
MERQRLERMAGPKPVRHVRHRLTEAAAEKRASLGGPTSTLRKAPTVTPRRADRLAGSTITTRKGTFGKT